MAHKAFADATLADIAREAETQAGSLYYYFPSREKLVEAVLMVGIERLSEMYDSLHLTDADIDPLERLREFSRSFSDEMTRMRGDNYLLAYLRNAHQLPDHVRDALRQKRRRERMRLTEIVRELQAGKVITADHDAALIAQYIFGAISWIGFWYVPGGSITPHDASSMVNDLLFDGLLKSPPQIPQG